MGPHPGPRVSGPNCASENRPVSSVRNDPIAGAEPVMTGLDPLIAARLKRDASGLVPAVVQQHDTGAVLMLAWMNDAALHATLTSGRATYWSRSRGSMWMKGETSGHHQAVVSVAL